MLKNVASTFVIKMSIAVTNLLIVIALSRYVGADGKGEASLLIASIAMALVFCNIVGGASLPYFVNKHSSFLLFFLSNTWTILICLILWLITLFFQSFFTAYSAHIILLTLFSSMLSTNLSILLGKDKVQLFNWISLLQVLLNLILMIALFTFKERDVLSYIYSYYISLFVCFIFSLFVLISELRVIDLSGWRALFLKMFRLGANNQIGHLMKFFSGRLGFYLLAFYSGNASLGSFSNAVSLIESVLMISNSYSTVLYPKVINAADPIHAQELTLSMFKQSSILSFLALILLVALPDTLWIFIFGIDFSGIQPVLAILAPGILFYSNALILTHYFSGIGKVSVNTKSAGVGLLITLLSSLCFIPMFDNFSAGIVLSISNLAISIFLIYYFIKTTDYRFVDFLPRWADLQSLLVFSKSIFSKRN